MIEISDREMQELRTKALRWAIAMDRQHGKHALHRLDIVIASSRTDPYARLAALATRPELVILREKRRREQASRALVVFRPTRFGLNQLAGQMRRAFAAAGLLTRRSG